MSDGRTASAVSVVGIEQVDVVLVILDIARFMSIVSLKEGILDINVYNNLVGLPPTALFASSVAIASAVYACLAYRES